MENIKNILIYCRADIKKCSNEESMSYIENKAPGCFAYECKEFKKLIFP